jgi:zinc D-Ala-D-Ala dipeptidase
MNKIIQACQLRIFYGAIFLSTAYQPALAQDTLPNRYGLRVIGTVAALQQTVAQNPDKAMVSLSKAIPGIVLDLRYATTNNFMRTRLYGPLTTTYLRRPAAEALARAQAFLRTKGLGLKIWDAYRPYSVTEAIWLPVQDERYASNPARGSGHNRGTAVDLTLIRLSNRQELPMGTAFDNFSDTAHHGFTALPAEVLQNRQLLKQAMEAQGFRALDSEWWHYSLPPNQLGAKNYELLDIPFTALDAQQRTKRKRPRQ